MQKKLIALAVAGLVSVPAFAQSNVTIYGVVDMGYQYTGDSVFDNVKSRSGIDSGISAGSRIGFRGTEDLGNGLKAGFVLEQGIAVDTGNTAAGQGTFGRQSFVSLSGGFGTVALGRQYTPSHVLLAGNIDPFGLGKGTVGSIANYYIAEARLDNLAAYVSPNWGGFSFVAGYSFNAVGNEQSPKIEDAETDTRAWVIAPTYKNGPIYVAFNFHKLDPVLSGLDSTKVWDLGGTYDFGVAKVGAVYGQRKTDDVKVKQWALTGAVPVGAAGKVQVSYGQRKIDGLFNDDAKVSQWALGYEHALSKRTALYTAYAQQNQNDEQEFLTQVGIGGAGISDASGNNAGAGYQRGFNLGVRHSF
ncbi:MAG: porin [Thauera sp.]|nr:porin [Thauera sp.]